MTTTEIALAFAKSKGFISVDYQERWNGFDVYIAQYDGDDLVIGYPSFILVKDGIARISNSSELNSILNISEVPSDFTEELI